MLIAFIFTKLTQLQRTKTDLSKFESGNVGAEIGEAEFYKELIYHTSSPPVAEEKATEVCKILNLQIIKFFRLMNYWRQVQLNVNERIQFFRYSHQAHGLLWSH